MAETDEALTEKYLETLELSEEEFTSGLQNGIMSGKIVPILASSVAKNFGINEMLSVVAGSFPAHCNAKSSPKTTIKMFEIEVSADAPFFAQVFRSVVDPLSASLPCSVC